MHNRIIPAALALALLGVPPALAQDAAPKAQEKSAPTAAPKEPPMAPVLDFKPTPDNPLAPLPWQERLRRTGSCEEGRKILEAVAETGDAAAQAVLGELFEAGVECMPRDPAQAAALYQRALDNGNRMVALRLGYLYLLGRGVRKDTQKALDLFHPLAAEVGLDATGRAEEAVRSYFGFRGVPEAFSTLVKFYRDAEKGDPKQLFLDGNILIEGRGVPKNEAVGQRWVAIAAEKGVVEAQTVVGQARYAGAETLAQREAAVAMLHRAATDFYPPAMSQIGLIWEQTAANDTDRTIAYAWLARAAEAESQVELVKPAMERLRAALPRTELRKAEALAAEIDRTLPPPRPARPLTQAPARKSEAAAPPAPPAEPARTTAPAETIKAEAPAEATGQEAPPTQTATRPDPAQEKPTDDAAPDEPGSTRALFRQGMSGLRSTDAIRKADGMALVHRAAREGYAPAQEMLGLLWFQAAQDPVEMVFGLTWLMRAQEGGIQGQRLQQTIEQFEKKLKPQDIALAKRLSADAKHMPPAPPLTRRINPAEPAAAPRTQAAAPRTVAAPKDAPTPPAPVAPPTPGLKPTAPSEPQRPAR